MATTKVDIDPNQIDLSSIETGSANASYALDRLDATVSKLTSAIGNLAEKLTSFSGSASITSGLSSIGNEFKNISNNIKIVGDGLEALNKDISNSASNFNELTNKLKTISVNAIGYFAGASTAMSNFSSQGANAGNKLSAAFADSAERIANILKVPTGEIKRMISHIESTQGFENAILGMVGATGEFGELVKKTGEDFHNFTSVASHYKELIKDTAEATNTLITDVAKYASLLGTIQGALSTDVLIDAHEPISMLGAAMTIAAGTGQDFSKIVEDLKNQYEKFNSVGKESLAVTSRIASASQNLQIPLELVRSTVNEVSSQFLMMGNNSQAAINILSRFSPALKESGLGPEGIRQIVSGITSGINQMSVAQRAFLSAQAGGPGGLRGAIRVENLLREGKLDEVVKMAEEALRKQFGGRIITTEEAEKNDALARQHLQQRQFLMSGAFGGLAKNEAEAAVLLNALSKGNFSEAISKAKLPSSEDSLFENMLIGKNLQLRQWNEFIDAANKIEAARMGIGNTLYDEFRKYLGAEGASRSDIMMSVNERAAASAGTKPLGEGRIITDEIFKEKIYEEFISGIKDIFSRVSQNITSEIKNMLYENTNLYEPGLGISFDRFKNIPQLNEPAPSYDINFLKPINYFEGPESSSNVFAPAIAASSYVGSNNANINANNNKKQIIELNMEMHCPQCHANTYKHVAEVVFDNKINEDRSRVNMGAVLV